MLKQERSSQNKSSQNWGILVSSIQSQKISLFFENQGEIVKYKKKSPKKLILDPTGYGAWRFENIEFLSIL